LQPGENLAVAFLISFLRQYRRPWLRPRRHGIAARDVNGETFRKLTDAILAIKKTEIHRAWDFRRTVGHAYSPDKSPSAFTEMTGPVHRNGCRNGNRKTVTAILLAAALAVGTPCLAGFLGGYRINLTASEPLGLWRVLPVRHPISAGDLVFICPPDNASMRAARERGYLHSGPCDGGFAPLIKTVIAVAGQTVEVDHEVRVDGRLIAHSAISKADGRGRLLLPYAGGTMPEDFVFVHSSFFASYDSRYFGPIPASGILGLAQEVLTFAG
jgi:conjugative transfer signal peptidase TraF